MISRENLKEYDKNGYFFIEVGSTKNDKNGKIADREINSVKELIIVNINK